MKFDILWNFISPVTGRVLSTTDYVLVGDRLGIATPSPILIDIRLDLINLRKDYNIATSADFVIGTPNMQLPNAQVLNTMANGYVYNIAGIVSTVSTIPIGDLPNLTQNYIWIGDSSNRPIETATILLDNLPNLTSGKIWIGNIINRPQEGNPTSGPEGPEGPRGPQGYPGLSYIAVLKEIFKRILESILGDYFGSITADVFERLFEIWLKATLLGIQGIIGITGAQGLAGVIGLAGSTGIFGPAGTNAITTVKITTNFDMLGNRVENIGQSPGGDFDAVSAKWVWDLLHDNVIIKWQ